MQNQAMIGAGPDTAGDKAIAERVGCSRPATEANASAGCCGGPAPAGVDACCKLDASAKAAGASGCGCSKRSS